MVEIAEQNYTKELKKATYYVKEIADTLKSNIKEDLLLAQEKICEINKTLENSADAVKDAMLDKEKPFEEVRAWSNARKWNWKRKKPSKKWQSRKLSNCRSIR